MTPSLQSPLVAVDIGNSRIKAALFTESSGSGGTLPQPARDLSLAVDQWEPVEIALWLAPHEPSSLDWLVGSIQEPVAERLQQWLANEKPAGSLRCLRNDELPMAVNLPAPDQVGIDRLLAAVAANRIRSADRAVVVIDLGSAITVDVISREGEFCGGAILPGIRMAARALHQYTDKLPELPMSQLQPPPPPLGTSTDEAIASGLYWGAVGALKMLIQQLNREMSQEPLVVLTGGGAATVIEALGPEVNYQPHLVLSGIAIVHEQMGSRQ